MLIDLPIEIITLEDTSYHLMIEALFNETVKGNLIIDTGASKTVFDEHFVSEFITGVEEIDEQNSTGINAMITDAKIGILSSINFGTLHITNYKALLLDLSHINKVYKKYSKKEIAGLIGSDFLVEHNAIIDYGAKIITLNTQPG